MDHVQHDKLMRSNLPVPHYPAEACDKNDIRLSDLHRVYQVVKPEKLETLETE